MKKAQFYNLAIDDLVYHETTIVRLLSEFNKTEPKSPSDSHLGIILGTPEEINVKLEDCEQWNLMSLDAPLEVRHELLRIMFEELNDFVRSRVM